jgi:6-phosphogluconate dehydrogenase
MCVFNDYIRLQDELRESRKEIITVTKNYNNVLKIFQNGNIIDSANAEKIKAKYDELQRSNEMIASKKEAFQQVEKGIEEYLTAMNGMAIRHKFVKEGIDQSMVFDLEVNTYGEQVVKSVKEI